MSATVNSKDTGDESEVAILQALISAGYSVSIPFGDNDKYDLVVDDGESFQRVQCKTGWLEDECVRFKTCSKTTANGEVVRVDYEDEIEAFAVRCKDTGKVYWVPEEEAGQKNTYLRVVDPKIDHPSVNLATEYEFDGEIP
ncbi:group I intron-associated PD-(D/E)XK endonuclease [Halorussus halobius]|uniref:group I intron-associated PD-(D/E)XK endonuclease n=1 Tax=Halorussus halobius TaxID=1710537 RepID=UPI001091C9BD|nr:group I intron-associated PD-(D/E)XK endonuclease [Halorussus halobius]